jgi:hypothetical protein
MSNYDGDEINKVEGVKRKFLTALNNAHLFIERKWDEFKNDQCTWVDKYTDNEGYNEFQEQEEIDEDCDDDCCD